jgi:hypothetical protein
MQQLKAYCHTNDTWNACSVPLECREVSFLASAPVLREIAAFLLRCADRVDESPSGADHFHLRDECNGWEDSESPDVVVVIANATQ